MTLIKKEIKKGKRKELIYLYHLKNGRLNYN